MKENLSRDKVIQANRYVHSSIVDEYNNSPHFRPENKERVALKIDQLLETMKGRGLHADNAIDFCCGTGFIIDMVKSRFTNVVGVDVTQEMLDKVNISSGNIELFNALAEDVPFEDASFDMATAYSCLDHLLNYEDFFAEAYRVLKPGGVLYVDLNPNRFFWNMLSDIKDISNIEQNLKVEVYNTLSNDERNSKKYNLDIEKLILAEPTKNYNYGFDEGEIKAISEKVGFSTCETSHHWFLNEGIVLHESSSDSAALINEYLQSILPVSKHMFKYLGFVMVK